MSDEMTRRRVLGLGGAALAGAALPGAGHGAESHAAEAPGFRISLNTSTLRGFKLPITETIDIAARAGYSGIEPWPDELKRHVEGGGKLRDVGKQLDDAGLRVTGAIAFFPWMVDDDATRQRGLEEAKRYMEELAAIGASHVAAPPSGDENDVNGVELLAAADRYRDLLDVAEEFGVIPSVEVWGFRKNLNRLGQAVLVAIEARHPKACILPDVYHLYKGGSGLSSVRFLNPDLLAGFHFNDYPDIPIETIKDADRVYPGDGVAPLQHLFRDLWHIGYRGPLSIELFNPEYWKGDAFEVAKTALEKTRAVMESAFADVEH